MRAAQINNDGVVVNFVLVGGFDAQFIDPAGADIGWRWNGERFVQPALEIEPGPMVPARVPMLNAHLELIEAGWMPAVDAFIEAMPEPDRSLAQAWLAQALTMARDHPLVLAIPAALGKTETEVDELFIRAGARDA